MSDERPDPDALLAQMRADVARSRRGKLKIFFGYAAGVGKTYAMLESARRERASGVDVVVGYVEPHGRAETEALLEGLEVLPPKMVPYRGVELREFDLDAALARKPTILLVDELAHSNAAGCRHAKRWQDVQELLAAGIDVYSTLNVQHIESLNDVIAQITGVIVRETLPDSVVEQADDLELVDITPEELVDRLKAGKVYVPRQAERAIQQFFQHGNLVALRELSLRQTADRVQRDVEQARKQRSAKVPWATQDRVLVCIGPSPRTARVIRTAKRMATAFDADWAAVAVETGRPEQASPEVRERIARHLRLAEQLGAETYTLVGDDVAATVLDWAREQNVTKIVVGKTGEPWWKRVVFGSIVQDVLRDCGDIDVYVIHGEEEERAAPLLRRPLRPTASWDKYVRAAVAVAVCTLIGFLFQWLGLAEANIVMQYLLGVAFVATRYGRGPSFLASIASVLVFDFCFVPPHFTFAVSDTEYVLTFGVMLVIGLLISTLATRLQAQVRAARDRERRTSSLYRLTRTLGQISGTDFLVNLAGQQLREILRGEVVVYLREPTGDMRIRFGEATEIARHHVNPLVARWVADHEQVAGAGTDTLPNATALFVPLVASQRTIGAVGVRSDDLILFHDPEQRRLLETCAGVIAQAIERDQIALEAHETRLQMESERLRNSLLSAVSHDLRTPLAAIAGASSTLLAEDQNLRPEARRELAESIFEETDRLNRLVANLLDMTRLEGGVMTLKKEWQPIEEIVGVVLRRLAGRLANHTVSTHIPPDVPLAPFDDVLLQQVLMNLLENAAKYSPEGESIEVSARAGRDELVIDVADRGRGLQPGEASRVFDKFYRGAETGPRSGAGLGLTICRGIVELHGGRIWAENRAGGGAVFRFTIPIIGNPPSLPLETSAATIENKGI